MRALALRLRIAVGETSGQMKITLLLLGIWVFSSLSTWPQTGHCQYLSPPEVVIPWRVTGTSRGTKTPGWVSYSLHLEGQRHIIHMKVKKFLVYRQFSVYTYTDQGALHQDQTFIPTDCCYHGYVEGSPKSLVALSTCFGGFQGLIHINDTSYEIKPKAHSTTFEHLAYKMHPPETQSQSFRGTVREEDKRKKGPMKFKENNHSTLLQSATSGWYVHEWFYKVGVVIGHGRFLHRGSNVTEVNMDTIICANVVDSYYKTLGINVVIMTIEILTETNPVTAKTAYDWNKRFCNWKTKNLASHAANDATIIFIKQDGCFEGLYSANDYGLCTRDRNCGLQCYTDEALDLASTTMAHVLGHILGMEHIGEYCSCDHKHCIMHFPVQPSSAFSNCSFSRINYSVWVSGKCLYNAPVPEQVFKLAYCGNNVVDEGEDCDCGTTKSCADDTCCLENCLLSPGSACASGLCCKDCQVIASGTLCREQISECDLPEWCDGTSSACPEDVYVEDGLPCLGRGSCYEGRCSHRDYQCKALFGEDATDANLTCYKELNSRGDRFGHCSRRGYAYVGCSEADVLCGRIQCDNVKEVPILKDHETVIWIHMEPLTCWSVEHHYGKSTPDTGAVHNGTECGEGKMCMQGKCVSTPERDDACDPDTCKSRGLCNNKHHCHCSYGWAPPTCETKGFGGSVDSGPPPIKKKTKPIIKEKKKKSPNLFVILIFVLILCLLVFLFVLHKQLQKKNEQKVPAPPGAQGQNVPAPPGAQGKNVPAPPGPQGKNVPAPPGAQGKNVPAPPGAQGKNVPAPPGAQGQNVPAPPGEAGQKLPPKPKK